MSETMPQKTKHTPMMEQYFSIKDQYPDSFLFYRLGDFYELFYDDALKAAQLLEITLTSRNKNADDPIPMCGVPHHAAKEYIRTLVEMGYKVAICEQMEDPKTTKGMVKRDVVQVITPGTYTDYSNQNAQSNHYLVAITKSALSKGYTLAYVDVTTGELRGTQLTSFDALKNELSAIQTREVIVNSEELARKIEALSSSLNFIVSLFNGDTISEDQLRGYQSLWSQVEAASLKASFNYLLAYLISTQKRSLSHLQVAVEYQVEHFLKINFESKRNLELLTSLKTQLKNGSLYWFLDETKTAMGSRLLKKWIEKPLVVEADIVERHQQVESLINHYFERSDISSYLTAIYDLERIVGKISFGTANARDLLQLKQSLLQIPHIAQVLGTLPDTVWARTIDFLDPVLEVVDIISRAIDEDAPLQLKDGNVIRAGYSNILDDYRDTMANGKQWIAALQAQEREKTGIKTLKINYNRVFGYYIEVTKANVALLDESRYERKQTLANAERYVTPELKEQERKILEAEEKSSQVEYDLFIEIRELVKSYSSRLQSLAATVASLDVLQSFALVSEQYQFVQPQLSFDDRDLEIIDGRHPVVEKVMGQAAYVPNSISMDKNQEILLITGPNMSGKSTYMRQLALIVILAQMGCFVPAKSAKLPIFKQVFTRIGAADDLIAGQSTFMVEMLETNVAIQEADKYSLLLFDEIGRGTATYDGMALAQAILQYIHEKIPAKTLFSTHYHELTDLSQELKGLRNVHVGAIEKNGEVVFLHKIMEGPADKSYGIHVAKLAGLPKELLKNAQKILSKLESQASKDSAKVIDQQLSLFEETELNLNERAVSDQIQSLNLAQLTPIQVLNLVVDWQELLKGDES